jgi:glycosyltransferase involved in cell wall biosynthesis
MVAACPFPYPRGTPTRIWRMSEALVKRGHEIRVVAYHLGQSATDPPFSVHRIPNVRTYQKVTPGPTYQKLLIVDALLILKLREVLRGCEVDLIHAHHYEALIAALLAASRSGPPIIYDAHTLLRSELPYYGLGLPRRAKQTIGRLLDRRLPDRADHVIAASARIKTRLIEETGLPEEKVTVITGGVQVDHFASGTAGPQTSPDKVKTLIYTGNMAPYQGVDLMLKALKEVTNRRGDIRLLIVTDSPFKPYEKLAKELGVRGEIELVDAGYEALPKLLAGADVALNPRTECDGYPQKLLNYMAAGKASVSFAGSAGSLENGVQGLVVPDEDVTAFAEAILQLLDDPGLAQEMGLEAQAHVTAAFSWGSVAKRAEAVYNRLLHMKDGS